MPLEVRNFHGRWGRLNGRTTLQASLADLIRCAITVGYPNLGAATGPFLSRQWFAANLRRSLVRAYLEVENGRFCKSDVYERADRSEKAAISYYLGLIAARLVGERLLGVTWLLHFDQYREYLQQPIRSHEQRPDLIAWDMGFWYVIEAKGRSHRPEPSLRERAKAQASSVGHVDLPTGRRSFEANVASIAWFADEGWTIEWEDPEPKSTRRLKLTADEEQLRALYYQPILGTIKYLHDNGQPTTAVRIGDGEYLATEDPTMGTWVGLHQALVQEQYLAWSGVEQDINTAVHQSLLDDGASKAILLSGVRDAEGKVWSMGLDGVIVRTLDE